MTFLRLKFKQRGSRPHTTTPVWLVGLLFGAVLPLGLAAQGEAAGSEPAQTGSGWVCGVVVDETSSFVAEAEAVLRPQAESGAPGSATRQSVARAITNSRGTFCIRDLLPGFYQLQVIKDPWPAQPPRTVEVRAGMVNRLTPPIELELEPGEPRISYSESFDGMSAVQGRAVMERLVAQGDAASIEELARRLLPKRGPRLDLAPLVLGLDVKPLADELMRQLRSGYLPPLKTARYLYAVGELADERTRDNVIQLMLGKLRDARRLPPSPYTLLGESGETGYVSDQAIHALARIAGKDFGWKYGKPPLQNQKSIRKAQTWWDQELRARRSDR